MRYARVGVCDGPTRGEVPEQGANAAGVPMSSLFIPLVTLFPVASAAPAGAMTSRDNRGGLGYHGRACC